MSKKNVRELILDIVHRIEKDGGYSHLLINHYINTYKLSDKDIRLLTNVVYGTIQHRITLDFYLKPFLRKNQKIDDWVASLLRLSVYQMAFLDRIPNHAIIYEAVEIAKGRGHRGIASFVNGVLRNIQRNGLPNLEDIKESFKRLSVETSHPKWLLKRWSEQYGDQIARNIAKANIQQKQLSVRVNKMKTSREEMLEKLKKYDVIGKPSPFSNQGIIIEKGNLLDTPFIKEGFVTIQDQSSMLVTELLNLEDNMIVLDACSAPGGKTTHIGEKLNNTGKVFAFDLHKSKTKLVKENAKRLELTNILVDQSDARSLKERFQKETFDRILLDVPCSGFGVLRSKPDIKYHKDQQDIQRLSRIQLEILKEVAPLLKKDGVLVYSTCTITKEENEHTIKSFLKEMLNFKIDEYFFSDLPEFLKNSEGISSYGVQIFPQTYNTDGFFISRIVKK